TGAAVGLHVFEGFAEDSQYCFHDIEFMRPHLAYSCRRGRRHQAVSALARCSAYSRTRPSYDSKGGNFSKLWIAVVVAQANFSLVYVSIKGENQSVLSSMVGRIFTNVSATSGRVNIQVMQCAQK